MTENSKGLLVVEDVVAPLHCSSVAQAHRDECLPRLLGVVESLGALFLQDVSPPQQDVSPHLQDVVEVVDAVFHLRGDEDLPLAGDHLQPLDGDLQVVVQDRLHPSPRLLDNRLPVILLLSLLV
jgi:hypothetical protein